MTRVKTIGSRVTEAKSRLTPQVNYGRGRARYEPGRDGRRSRVFARDKFRCQECLSNGVINILLLHSSNRDIVGYVDHYIPLAQGGQDTESNQWLLCKVCHDAKSVHDSKGVIRDPKDFGSLGVHGFA